MRKWSLVTSSQRCNNCYTPDYVLLNKYVCAGEPSKLISVYKTSVKKFKIALCNKDCKICNLVPIPNNTTIIFRCCVLYNKLLYIVTSVYLKITDSFDKGSKGFPEIMLYFEIFFLPYLSFCMLYHRPGNS